MDHDAVGGCGCRTSTRAGLAVVRRDGELVGKARLVAIAGSPRHAAALTTTFARGGGAERRWSAASTTTSVRDHVPVVHGDAAKCAKMEACVVCCVWMGVGEGGNKLPDLTPESSIVVVRDGLLGWLDIIIGAVQY